MSEKQCQTCGRVEWTPDTRATTEKGNKARQGSSDLGLFREWRYTWGDGAYVTDCDQVEWRRGENGELLPAAVLELTGVRGVMPVPDSYLEAISTRMERDFQGEAARLVAQALGVYAWIVAWRTNLADFWIYNLSEGRGWWHLDRDHFQAWLRNIHLVKEKAA